MFRKEQMDLAPRVCNESLPEYSKNITILCFFAVQQRYSGWDLRQSWGLELRGASARG